MSINEIEELAKAATKGPWSVDPLYGFIIDKDAEPIEFFDPYKPCDNADYIVAANPEAILSITSSHRELLEALKTLSALTECSSFRASIQVSEAIKNAEALYE